MSLKYESSSEPLHISAKWLSPVARGRRSAWCDQCANAHSRPGRLGFGATKWLPKWPGCEPRLIVLSLDAENGSIVRGAPVARGRCEEATFGVVTDRGNSKRRFEPLSVSSIRPIATVAARRSGATPIESNLVWGLEFMMSGFGFRGVGCRRLTQRELRFPSEEGPTYNVKSPFT